MNSLESCLPLARLCYEELQGIYKFLEQQFNSCKNSLNEWIIWLEKVCLCVCVRERERERERETYTVFSHFEPMQVRKTGIATYAPKDE